jgi:hypothetical protein
LAISQLVETQLDPGVGDGAAPMTVPSGESGIRMGGVDALNTGERGGVQQPACVLIGQ